MIFVVITDVDRRQGEGCVWVMLHRRQQDHRLHIVVYQVMFESI